MAGERNKKLEKKWNRYRPERVGGTAYVPRKTVLARNSYVKRKANFQMQKSLAAFKNEFVQNRRTLKLEYCTPINGNTSTGQGASNPTVWFRFLLNNIYRPYSAVASNVTPVSGIKNNSVQEYDAVETYYNKYIVYGCLVELTANNLGGWPLVMGMTASCDTGNIATTHLPSDIVSRDYVYSKTLSAGILGGVEHKSFRKYFDIRKIRGLRASKREYVANDDNGVAFDSTTTPGSTWLNIFWGAQADAISQGYAVDGMLKMTYYLVAYDKKNETDQPN